MFLSPPFFLIRLAKRLCNLIIVLQRQFVNEMQSYRVQEKMFQTQTRKRVLINSLLVDIIFAFFPANIPT